MPKKNILSDIVGEVKKDVDVYRSGAAKRAYEEPPKSGREFGEKIKMAREALATPSAPGPEPIRPMAGGKDKVGKGAYGSQPGEKRMDVGEMTKPLGSFKKGGEVPMTGMYKMEKGEHVLTKDHKENMKDALSLAGAALSHDKPEAPPAPPKVDRAMHIKKLADASFHIRHEHDHPEVHKDEEYSAKNLKELKQHMDDHFGKDEMKETPKEESQETPGVEQMEKALGYEK